METEVIDLDIQRAEYFAGQAVEAHRAGHFASSQVLAQVSIAYSSLAKVKIERMAVGSHKEAGENE